MAMHVLRDDGWENVQTGLGGLRDKTSYHTFVDSPPLLDQQLEALFNNDDIAAKIVGKLVREAIRAGFGLSIKGAEGKDAASVATAIVAEATRLNALAKLGEGWLWARLYGGGSGVFVGARDGRAMSRPLDMNRVQSIEFLNVVKRPMLRVVKRYDKIDRPQFGEPELYTFVIPGESRELVVHESRLILFRGALTARSTALAANNEWDNSVLQRAYGAIQRSSSAWLSVDALMSDASQGVLKIQNLVNMIKQQGETLLRKRMQIIELGRSVCRALVIDADKEEFTRVTTSFTGMPEVLDKQMHRVSAAGDMPQTVLFGRSPAGMNATGDSDMRSWYDAVAAERDAEFKPRLEQLIRMIMSVPSGPTQGKILDEWELTFPPLWQLSDKEKADVLKVTADALVALVNAQVIEPEAAALHLAHSGTLPELDIETLETVLSAMRKARLEDPLGVDDPIDDPNDPNDDPNNPPQDKNGNQLDQNA